MFTIVKRRKTENLGEKVERKLSGDFVVLLVSLAE